MAKTAATKTTQRVTAQGRYTFRKFCETFDDVDVHPYRVAYLETKWGKGALKTEDEWRDMLYRKRT